MVLTETQKAKAWDILKQMLEKTIKETTLSEQGFADATQMSGLLQVIEIKVSKS